MLIAELKKFIMNEITVGGAIPFTMDDKELERIIQNETEEVYTLYREAITQKVTIMKPEVFRTKEFRENRTFQLPGCVTGIADFKEMKSTMQWMGFATGDRDITFEKALSYSIWMNPGGSDYLASATCTWAMWDQMKSFILRDIQFKFNPLTHRLTVFGHDPSNSVLLNFYVKVPDYELWEDPWVRKWICAKAKRQMAKAIGLFGTSLLGGTTINHQMLTDEATNEIQECKDFFDKTNVPDWFLDIY